MEAEQELVQAHNAKELKGFTNAFFTPEDTQNGREFRPKETDVFVEVQEEQRILICHCTYIVI